MSFNYGSVEFISGVNVGFEFIDGWNLEGENGDVWFILVDLFILRFLLCFNK